MFRNLLNPDNPLMVTLSQITDCIFLSLFFLLGCAPLVTAGASVAALYDATYRGFRRKEKNSWQRFWAVFRQNWKAGILPSLVFGILFAGLVRAAVCLWNAAVYTQISWVIFSAGAVAAATAAGILSLLFPMLSRFDNSLGALLKNTLLLALANMPRTIALGLVTSASVLLCLRYVFPLFFLPSLAALISSLFIEPMFRPYMSEEDAAA